MTLLAQVVLAQAVGLDAPNPGHLVQPSEQYQLGSKDRLNITVWGEEDLSDEFTVDELGTIQVPLVGRLEVAGMTAFEVSAMLTKRLSDGFILKPNVVVDLVARESEHVDVLGAIAQPGLVHLHETMRLMDVLSSVGGIKGEQATELRILRSGETIVVPLEQLLHDGHGDLVVEPGDRVVVPFGPMVYAAGQVKKTGPYGFREGMTATQLLSAAGGPNNTANLRKAYILRDGERIAVNLKRIIKGRASDVIVRPNDQLIVQESVF